MTRAVLNAAAREDRKKARKSLGRISDLRIAPSTRKRYVTAYFRFTVFCNVFGLLPIIDTDHLDQCLARFIETCWEEGEPRPWANDTIAALQFFVPSVKHCLGLSWSLAGAWARRELPARALPITPQVVAAIAGGFLLANEPRLAAAFVLGFDCLTRTPELLSLILDGVQPALEGSAAVVLLRSTKTSGRAGVHESIVIDHEVARGALR